MISKSEGFKMNGKVYNSLPELELARKFEKVTTFTTTDGKTFSSESSALAHQDSLLPHRVELKDLLNKILILADQNTDDLYLQHIKEYVSRVINSTYEAEYNEEQYYNSNCY